MKHPFRFPLPLQSGTVADLRQPSAASMAPGLGLTQTHPAEVRNELGAGMSTIARRHLLLGGGAALLSGLAGAPQSAWAGAQVEEPLADAVRSVLSAAVANDAPPKPHFDSIEPRLAYLRWLGEMGDRLKRQKAESQTRIEFLETVWYESTRAGLEPALVLGLIQVESGFRKYAISVVGARGYMQVMPFWARLIGDGQVSRLFHMQTNLRFGCIIMRHYLDRENGDLFLALGRYNGSRGKREYPDLVFGARKRWLMPST